MTKIQKGIQLAHFMCSIAYYRTHKSHTLYVDLNTTDLVTRDYIKSYIHNHLALREMNN